MFIRTHSSVPVIAVALGLTMVFWWPLYGGAGFIGGDLYPYFFPQKTFYSDCLKSGVFPLWNDLTGFGYPVLGESQTGAAYPLHLVSYLCFDLNTAYNIEHLLHYVICFVATCFFARRLGLTDPGAFLTALVFTYGWFPPRACLEWAILTGAWLPVALWCAESFLQTRLWRFAMGLSVAIGLQLLAGHYHLAFITQLLVVTYVGSRLWVNKQSSTEKNSQSECPRNRTSTTIGLALALVAGMGLACVQLLPTWELKQRSSRVVTGGDYDPAYGQMPPAYISQLIVPWRWYSLLAIDEDNLIRDTAEFFAPWFWFSPQRDFNNPNQPYDLDQAIQRCRTATVSTGTNKVEAHFYCGMVPIGLAFLMLVIRIRRGLTSSISSGAESVIQKTTLFWLVAGSLALIYATGLLLPIGRNIPGFSFFRGSGRYGIVTTLTIALLAGEMLSHILRQVSFRSYRVLLMLMIFGSTCGDLWLVSRMVKYTVMVSPPRISFREASIVRQRLLEETTPPRLLAPGPNVGNLLGVSCVPWYLGIAPAEYVNPQFSMPPIPKALASKSPTPADPELIEWLSRSGVTHVLNFDPLDEPSWQVELVWKGIDPFLNRVWGRDEPIFLYRFRSSQDKIDSTSFPGRAYIIEGNGRVVCADWKKSRGDSRRFRIESDQSGKSKVVLTELAFPGWIARQGSKVLETEQAGLFRAIQVAESDAEIVCTYEPSSVYYGTVVSLVTVLFLAAIAHMRFWYPAVTDRMVRALFGGNQ